MARAEASVKADDIDSIERADEDAIEYFTFAVPQSKSKVLITSRRTLFGMANTTTQVEGFSESDVGRFITSRCTLFNLDRQMFTSQLVKELVAATEGSPLNIEDLIRLMAIVPPKEAIKVWANKQGQEARKYALGRELDMLSREARHVLIAACLYNGAVSYPELRAVTGYGDQCLSDGLAELQLNAAAYRALAISAFFLRDKLLLLRTFSEWFNECPDDPRAHSEWQRISARLGLSSGDLDVPEAIIARL